jgi:hypothetical protein
MSLDHWFALVNFLAMAVAGILLWTVRSAFRSGQWATKLEQRVTNNEQRLHDMNERLDRAGEQMSKVATAVQGLPERFRDIFLSQREFDKHREESLADRRDLWSALNRRRVDR